MVQTCYTPDGTEGSYTPCDTSADVSACCASADACISNGYCFQQSAENGNWNNRLSRGMCTDKTWNSTSCPQFCSDVSTDSTNSVVIALDQKSGEFCCGVGGDGVSYNSTTGQCILSTQSSTDRPLGTEPFTINEGQVIYDRSNGARLTGTAVAASATATVTATVTANAASSNVSKGEPNVAAIAAGIAVPLGVLLLAALLTTFFFRSKTKKLQTQLQEMSLAQGQQPHWGPPHPQQVVHVQRHELGTSGVPFVEAPGSSK